MWNIPASFPAQYFIHSLLMGRHHYVGRVLRRRRTEETCCHQTCVSGSLYGSFHGFHSASSLRNVCAVFKRLVFCLSGSCLGANFMFQSCKATSGSSDSEIGGTNSALDSCEMGFKIRAFQDGSCRGEVVAWALHLLKTSTSDPLMFRSGIGSCLELRATSRELINTQSKTFLIVCSVPEQCNKKKTSAAPSSSGTNNSSH